MALSIRGFDIVRKIPSIFPLFSNEGVTQAVQIPQFFTRLFLVGVNDVRNNGGKSTRTQNTVTGVLVLFLSKSGALIGLTFIAIVFVACVFAPWVAPFDPIEQNRSALLLPPAWLEGGIPLICWVLTILGVIFFPVLFMVQDCPSLSA
ncbi:hypothetical protein NJNGDCLN_00013 [Mannheimia haemolytica]